MCPFQDHVIKFSESQDQRPDSVLICGHRQLWMTTHCFQSGGYANFQINLLTKQEYCYYVDSASTLWLAPPASLTHIRTGSVWNTSCPYLVFSPPLSPSQKDLQGPPTTATIWLWKNPRLPNSIAYTSPPPKKTPTLGPESLITRPHCLQALQEHTHKQDCLKMLL